MSRLPSLLLALSLVGCGGPSHWYFAEGHLQHEWGYEGEIGPDHWAELSPDFRLAEDGLAQSPVDLPPDARPSPSAPSLSFHYHETRARWINNGHTLQREVGDDNHILWDGERYELAQFHVHAPSEHTVAGLHAQGEIHFVHISERGRVLVVGLFAVAGDGHPELEHDVGLLPAHEGEGTDLAVLRDPRDMLPDDRSFWWYDGSFTTPPCTEGVTWVVLREPVRVPASYLERVATLVGPNNRPVMPRNGRVVRASP